MSGGRDISIRPYAEGDMWILEKTLGDPAQMVHLNGPEGPEKLRKRHEMFLSMARDPRAGCPFTILSGRAPAGSVGYWASEWKGQKGWEMGWFVVPELQGRGVATAAARLLIARLPRLGGPRVVFAFPSADNHPSNAICRRLGFTLAETAASEYPPGSGRQLQVNVWKLELPSGDQKVS